MFKLVSELNSVVEVTGYFVGDEDSFTEWLGGIGFLFDDMKFTEEAGGVTKVTIYIFDLEDAHSTVENINDAWQPRLKMDK